MTDLSKTIIPKSDQLNADDFAAGPKTITITSVKIVGGDQPVVINFEGDDKHPFKPCKTMRRVLVSVWGSDGNSYVGRRLTLYCDPNVTWAGTKVGGIRISHMSYLYVLKPDTALLKLKEAIKLIITIAKGRRVPVTIFPLLPEELKGIGLTQAALSGWMVKMDGAKSVEELKKITTEIKAVGYDKAGRDELNAYYSIVKEKLKA